MAVINKQSRVPYYYQLADSLRQLIKNSSNNGEQVLLPSENELAKTHQISRATVRQALALLEREGLIYKAKGKGTFVAKRRALYELTSLIPTTDEMLRRGWKPGTQVISLNQIDTHSPITEALELEEGDQLYEVCRLRLGNDEPVCLQWSYLPAKMCPGLLQQDLTSSLTHLLDERYGLKFWSAHVVLRARLVTLLEARYLRVPAGSPVIYREQITYLPTGSPIEFLQSVWRSDRYDFTFTSSRSSW